MPKRMTQEEFCEKVKYYTKDTVEVISEYVNKRTLVTIKCKKCGYKWTFSPNNVMPSNINKYHFKGCPECKRTTVKCQMCGKEFKRLKSEIPASGLTFCSRECGNRYKNLHLFNKEDSSDYRRNAFLKYEHKCAICGYNEDTRILEVHHMDENRQNNHVDNLIILCPNCHKKLTLHLYKLKDNKLITNS